MQPDQLRREVNRLYWETERPVTRLADDLGVSRGTFYNHLDPLPAPGKCRSCGAPLYFRTRSNRDAGEAQCEACGNEQSVAAPAAGAGRDVRKLRVAAGTTAATGAAALTEGDDAPARFAFLSRNDEDHVRTQLLAVAVGAAIIGLGILYFSRRR